MKTKIFPSLFLACALVVTGCGSMDANINPSTSSGASMNNVSAKEPTEAQLSVPESQIKFNNVFYGEPLRMETEKTKCRNGVSSPLCSLSFKMYHIGDVTEAHAPLLQILIVDMETIKDPSLKGFVDTLTLMLKGEKKTLPLADDLFAKFNDEKVLLTSKESSQEKASKKYLSYYTVNEKNKKQQLFYTAAKTVKNNLVMIRLNAGVNQDTNKESFDGFKDCGKNCDTTKKATTYIAKKEAFAAYKTIAEKVDTMLVSFE